MDRAARPADHHDRHVRVSRGHFERHVALDDIVYHRLGLGELRAGLLWDRLEIETRGDGGGFAEAAGRLGCACAVLGGGRMKLVLPETVEIRDLYRLAAESSVQIRHLDYKRNSLQDIFLEAMEGARGGL